MKDKNTNLLIGKKLRQAREENNISIKDIANKVNVTRQTISNIENDTSMPSIALLCNIAASEYFLLSNNRKIYLRKRFNKKALELYYNYLENNW